MPPKQVIAQFRKSGDIQGIILAYELDAKKNQLNSSDMLKVYNSFSIVQREVAKECFDKNIKLGCNEEMVESFISPCKNNVMHNHGGDYYSTSNRRY